MQDESIPYTQPEQRPLGDLEGQIYELELKINVSLRLLARFAALNRRWPANGTYIEMIEGIDSHLEYWERKRQELKARLHPGAGVA